MYEYYFCSVENAYCNLYLPFLHIWYAERCDFPDGLSFHRIDISLNIGGLSLNILCSNISTTTHPVGCSAELKGSLILYSIFHGKTPFSLCRYIIMSANAMRHSFLSLTIFCLVSLHCSFLFESQKGDS